MVKLIKEGDTDCEENKASDCGDLHRSVKQTKTPTGRSEMTA
jgi:hypothetical protein